MDIIENYKNVIKCRWSLLVTETLRGATLESFRSQHGF